MSLGQKHLRRQFAARQTALERTANHLGVAARRSAPLLPPAHHGVEILIPEQGKFAEAFHAPQRQAADEVEISQAVRVADFAVSVKVENGDVGQLRRF